ncbi:DciA family protein [Streptomyces griseofuscus]|uniref:DciA family protein n=1 Tax=Streptomyces griseofuscus TaxID=146922 RepID=UPI00367B8446
MSTEPSGVDLARQALVAALEAAKKNGATQTEKAKRRTTAVVRRDGREPLGLSAAIGMMMTERGMAAPIAGGSVLADFDAILAAAAPELAGHIQAVGFDADTGRLDVAPDAPAYGTQLRWSAPKLITAANERVQGANVRALHVLAPATVKTGPTATATATPAPQTTVPTAPWSAGPRPRDTAARSRRTDRPPDRPWQTRPSRRRCSGRPPRCGNCRAGRSPSPTPSRMMRRPRSSRPAHSTAARPQRPRRPSFAGPEPNALPVRPKRRPPCRSPLSCLPRRDQSRCREVAVEPPLARETVRAGRPYEDGRSARGEEEDHEVQQAASAGSRPPRASSRWRTLTKLRTTPARATRLLRALTNLEVNR